MGCLDHAEEPVNHVGTGLVNMCKIGYGATRFSHVGIMGYWPVYNFPRSVGFVQPCTMVSYRIQSSVLYTLSTTFGNHNMLFTVYLWNIY